MLKKANITFDFDPESGEVKNVKCNIDGQVKRSTKSTKKDDFKFSSEDPRVVLTDSKLIFNNKALEKLDIEYGDRVAIIWKESKKGKIVPIIGTDKSFGESIGNRVTKAMTVNYKGKQNEVLSKYGTEFTLVEYENGLYELTTLDEVAMEIEKIVTAAEDVEIELVTELDEFNINELTYKL